MIDCSCDYDAPEVYSSRIVTARKQYTCEECGARIKPGDRYEYAFGVQDGFTYQPHTCLHCVDIRKFVATNIPCFCWAHGNLLDDCRNIIRAAYEQAADEVRGLAFGFGRLIVKAKRARGEAMIRKAESEQ